MQGANKVVPNINNSKTSVILRNNDTDETRLKLDVKLAESHVNATRIQRAATKHNFHTHVTYNRTLGPTMGFTHTSKISRRAHRLADAYAHQTIHNKGHPIPLYERNIDFYTLPSTSLQHVINVIKLSTLPLPTSFKRAAILGDSTELWYHITNDIPDIFTSVMLVTTSRDG